MSKLRIAICDPVESYHRRLQVCQILHSHLQWQKFNTLQLEAVVQDRDMRSAGAVLRMFMLLIRLLVALLGQPEAA